MTEPTSSSPRFVRALRDLMAWLEEAGVAGVIIGGVAASLLGRVRVTKDVDLLVSVEPDGWAEFVARGESHGLEPRLSDALEFARRLDQPLHRRGDPLTRAQSTISTARCRWPRRRR